MPKHETNDNQPNTAYAVATILLSAAMTAIPTETISNKYHLLHVH